MTIPTIWKMVAWFLCALLAVVVAVQAQTVGEANTPQLNLPRIDLMLGQHKAHVQVATTEDQLQKGLMFRRQMPRNEGMLFDFYTSAPRCFWMRNTTIPLSAAFADKDGRILNIVDMEPLSEVSHCSAQPARYVLEMQRGWFQERNIRPGTRILLAASS